MPGVLHNYGRQCEKQGYSIKEIWMEFWDFGQVT